MSKVIMICHESQLSSSLALSTADHQQINITHVTTIYLKKAWENNLQMLQNVLTVLISVFIVYMYLVGLL